MSLYRYFQSFLLLYSLVQMTFYFSSFVSFFLFFQNYGLQLFFIHIFTVLLSVDFIICCYVIKNCYNSVDSTLLRCAHFFVTFMLPVRNLFCFCLILYLPVLHIVLSSIRFWSFNKYFLCNLFFLVWGISVNCFYCLLYSLKISCVTLREDLLICSCFCSLSWKGSV